eukprot:353924-Chlamydomonas_euryale.AAC.2
MNAWPSLDWAVGGAFLQAGLSTGVSTRLDFTRCSQDLLATDATSECVKAQGSQQGPQDDGHTIHVTIPWDDGHATHGHTMCRYP